MEKYIITFFDGKEEELDKDLEVININNNKKLAKLLKLDSVRRLISNGGEPYGKGTKRKMDRKTGDYELWHDNTCLINECERIIPINYSTRKDSKTGGIIQSGLIYCEKFEGEKFFINYSNLNNYVINSKGEKEKTTEKFSFNLTKHCILNKETNAIMGVKSVKNPNREKMIKDSIKYLNIIKYLNNYQNVFTIKSLFTELVSLNMLSENDLSFLVGIVNKLIKEKKLSYTFNSEKEMLLSVNKDFQKKKTL